MNNNILSPQLVQALTQSLLQQLRPENSGTGSLQTLLQNAIINYNQPPRTPVHIPITSLTTPGGSAGGSTTPAESQGSITPADEVDDGTPLSRNSSTASAASTLSNSSLSSVASTHDWEDDEGEYLIKRRRPANNQSKSDKRIVTAPVMAEIDSEILALHPIPTGMASP